jgi:hypothetical protein
MTRRLLPLVVLALAASGPIATAAADGTRVGGTVPSVLALGLTANRALGTLPPATRRHTYGYAVHASVTTTVRPVTMSVSDGEATAAAPRGHLRTSHGLLGDPLTVLSPTGTWSPLTVAQAPVTRWPTVVASAPVALHFRQTVPAHRDRTVDPKLMLVTLAVEQP